MFNEFFGIKVGIEATGHYSNNILNFLTEKGFNIYLINPLQTNLYEKGQSLRKTKTDKSDAHVIATMLISDNLKPYIPVSYHISELKSLTRHRFRLVKKNSKFKTSLVRLVDIVFDSPAKLLTFAGLDPSIYQSGKFFSTHSVMVKRGSKYLRFALMNAASMVCMNDTVFNEFKDRKLSEGKHYRVTLGHVAKKLVRIIYYLLKTNSKYEASKVV